MAPTLKSPKQPRRAKKPAGMVQTFRLEKGRLVEIPTDFDAAAGLQKKVSAQYCLATGKDLRIARLIEQATKASKPR